MLKGDVNSMISKDSSILRNVKRACCDLADAESEIFKIVA